MKQPPDTFTIKNYKQNIQKQNHQQENEMTKKPRKQQEDRLLKQLSLHDRRRQMQLRQQIAAELTILTV